MYNDSIKTMGELTRLTIAQRAIWLAHQMDPSQSVYNIAQLTRIEGRFDPHLFEEAAASVVRDAQALHLRITVVGDEPYLSIISDLDWKLERFDLSADESPQQAAIASFERARKIPFDLTSGSLFRWRLYRLSDESWIWFQSYHHLIVDGWSIAQLERHVAERYSGLLHGQAVAATAVPPLTTQPDEAAHRVSRSFRVDRDYWLDSWRDAPKASSLSGVPAVTTNDSHRCSLAVPASLAGKIERFARDNALSKAQIYVAVAGIYVARMTWQSDVVLGVPVTARVGRRERSAIDMRANIAAMRLRIPAAATVSEAVALAGVRLRSAFRHQNYRYEDLRSDLGLAGRDEELFSFLVNLLIFDRPQAFGSAQANTEILWTGPVRDLALTVSEAAGSIQLYLDGNVQRYSEHELQAHLSRWALLLETICDADSQNSIASISLLNSTETDLVLNTFNATAVTCGEDLLPSLFETQVERAPEATALNCGSERVSYAELNARANRLAHALIRQGIGPERIVGIALERSSELIVALLAVLKAGAAYLPLDPDYPKERLMLMVQDAKAQIIISQQSLADRLPQSCPALWLDADDTGTALQAMPAANPGDRDRIQPLRPRNIAYVIYTSGSTGTPKGVAVTHAGLKNLTLSQADAFCASPHKRFLQFSSISFDASISEIAIALVSGSQLVIAPRDCLGEELSALIVKNEIDIAVLTPAIVRTIEDQINLETLAVVGERWSYSDVGDHIAATRLVNAYGPTEATVCATISDQVVDEHLIPIGRPIWNTRVYVLDQALEPVGIGVSGELYIGGVGLARGYLGRSGLTAERFIASPFGESGARMYRTGDLARWRADGQLEFLGRIDHQVKVRGYRIELGEIETVLLEHDQVEQVVVTARDDEAGGKRLVAYVVGAGGVAPEIGELRAHLKQQLPDYMVPTAFVVLEALPLTRSGKLDRGALPVPALVRDEGTAFRTPQGPVEEALARLMADLLGLDRVGADDNFFELGGHSLLAVRLIARVRQSIGTELSLRSLFQGPTPRGLAALIAASSNESHIPINHSSAEQVATINLRSGSQQPVFCVHPAGGVSTVYRFIASELQADVPVIGLQARGLDSDIEPHPTIHDMAEAYVRTVCEYQRSGPLRILGWSFGGLVALEMAAILEQMGRAPEQVLLMDSNLEASADVQQMTMSDCLRLFCNIFGFDFQETSAGETKRLLFEEMKTIKMFSDGNGIQFFERFLENFIHSVNLSQRWTPSKISAPIAYLRSNDNSSSDLEANLRQVTSGRFEIIDVDAPHHSMCSMTNSKKAAVHLDRLLARHSVERP